MPFAVHVTLNLSTVLSNARSFTVTAKEYLSGLIFFISKSQIVIFLRLIYFFEVCGKSGGPKASLSCIRRKCVLSSLSERGERAAESNFPPKPKSGDDAFPRGCKNGPYKRSLTSTAAGTTKSNRFNEQNSNSF